MQKRPLSTTTQLFQIIKHSYGFHKRRLLMKTASQVFQSIRIAVNDEFHHLRTFFAQLPTLLCPGAKIAVITFHSGEDRLVKQTVQTQPFYRKINKKVIKPTQREIQLNSRAKPAKLRGIEFTPHPI
jgi:16S rRNA (cytosine1402-N4)-methyltransferase